MTNRANWNDITLPLSAKIEDAIRTLNKTALKIVLVVDEKEVLKGTVSDGDIRRGLLKGLAMSSPISDIMNCSPTVVTRDEAKEKVKKMMIAKKIFQIPIVDENRKLTGIHFLDEISEPKKRDNFMVVMAGGKGSRLLPRTENIPKPMLQVGGMPILEHIIRRARDQGFGTFYISIGYLGHVIEDYFRDGDKLAVDIRYLREGLPLGTAGGLSLLEPSPVGAVIVTNGDVLTEIDYGSLVDFHLSNHAAATMAVQMHEWQNPFGVVETDGISIINYQEKPFSRSLINAGVYVLEPKVISLINESEDLDMPSLFQRARGMQFRVIAFPIHEQWIDIGSHRDFNFIENLYKDNFLNSKLE